MNRRKFALQMALAGASTAMPWSAQAQGAPVEGKDYARLAQPIAMPATGKVEVVEFFGYWCPHCNAFEPVLDAWTRKLPADVAFRRVPVAFNAQQEPQQKLYYALESMGQLEAMHRKVFTAIHVQKQRLEKDAEIVALVAANGIDAAKFSEAFKSFTVATKLKQARQLADAYRIDGVPTLGIHGRYFTSPSLAGGHEQALRVADHLIQRAKKV
jgi:protein dithiol oxidoreductase (disulfide-forming)